MNDFADRLKKLRLEKGATQKQVANTLEISQTCYAGYEQGYREPDFNILKKICIFFDSTSDYLLGLEEEDGSKISEYEFEYNHNNTHLKHKESTK